MKNKIAITISAVCLTGILFVFGLGILVTRNNNYEQAENNAINYTDTFSELYDGDPGIVSAASGEYRVTVIDATGKVIADSEYGDVSGMENHLNREEIIAAAENKPVTVRRKSETTGRDTIYYAVKKETADSYVFIRTAVNVASVNAYVIKTVPLMLGIAGFAVFCGAFCSVFFASRLVKPLSELKDGLKGIKEGYYFGITTVSTDKEVNEIVAEINSVGETLDETLKELTAERGNLNSIINTISDGIVLLNEGNVQLINEAAEKLFGCTDGVIGKNAVALTDNEKIVDAVSDFSEECEFECELNGRIVRCSVKRVENGALLAVFTDVTAERNSRQIRSEFFSNAGHELKTPLTTIIGFNDIIRQNDKKGALAKYTTQISSSANRMVSLVNDMLKLSELENTVPENVKSVDVAAVAGTVRDDLRVLSDAKNVDVRIEGETHVNATESHVYELLKNLVENSIKYGNENGFVNVRLSEDADGATIEVEDNGIGIEEKYQSRIFERFYRVEESRSRATGGTGLGLAIVKHIVLLYGGDISVKSKLGIGTTITVKFPL